MLTCACFRPVQRYRYTHYAQVIGEPAESMRGKAHKAEPGFEPSSVILSRTVFFQEHNAPCQPPYFSGLLIAVFGHHSLLFITVIVMTMVIVIYGTHYLAKVWLGSLQTLPQLVP